MVFAHPPNPARLPGAHREKIKNPLGFVVGKRVHKAIANRNPEEQTMTTFQILHARRRNAYRARAPYVVRAITKAGAFSKMAPSQFDYCDNLEAAQARVADLERMNPGRRFGIDTQG